MKLNALMESIQPLAVTGVAEGDIKGLTYDSRQVRPGFIFFAVPGQNIDGNRFIQDAIDRGAAVIVSERPTVIARGQTVFVLVRNVRRAMAGMAGAFYDRPSEKLQVIGITGTNGKTTIAFLLRDVLSAAGRTPGVVGTIQYEIGGRVIPAGRTTPESIDLQNMLAQMVHAGCRSAVMEVSSHALVQDRVWGIEYDAAIFTNLTHDHLDYHETKDKYFQAKKLLFNGLKRRLKNPLAIINIDDPRGQELARMKEIAVEIITYGVSDAACVRAARTEITSSGSLVNVESPWGNVILRLKLLGRFNVSNALAAFATGAALGVEPALIAEALGRVISVPGRLEEIRTGRDFQVFVDYAHTEDALRNVLEMLREITRNRLVVVFGCGGNRDRKKRPLMGAAVAGLADYAIITSDNPRKENPTDIIMQIRAGFESHQNYQVVEDRHEAILRALSIAEDGDVILIAGKGHENYQEFANTVIPFDDRQVVRECLRI